MKLPHMKRNISKKQRQIIAFGGLRFDEGGSGGELSGSLNLSARKYPCLTQREGRVQHQTGHSITALYASDGLFWVDGTDFYVDGEVAGSVSEGAKKFAAIHNDVVIFPDKKIYNSAEKTMRFLEAEHLSAAGLVSFSENTVSVTASGGVTYYADTVRRTVTCRGYSRRDNPFGNISSIATSTIVDAGSGAVIDQATGNTALVDGKDARSNALSVGSYVTAVKSSSALGDFQAEADEYGIVMTRSDNTKTYLWDDENTQSAAYYREYSIEVHGAEEREIVSLSELFKAGDAVEISGCITNPDNNKTAVIREVTDSALTFDAVFVPGEEEGEVSIRRKIPQFDCLCERDNRIYGAEGNTIYVSALGDPYNYFVFEGTNTDSYSVAVASEGKFTACAAYDNGVVFFKEEMVYKLLGDYPAEYSLYAYHMPGVQTGSAQSLVNINEVLYYKGKDGVYSYTGGAPRSISENFGLRKYKNAVGGGDGTVYYIAMDDEAEQRHIFTYDTEKGIWLEEDDLVAVGFAHTGGSLYTATANEILLVSGGEIEDMPWQADFVPITEEWYGKKSYSTLYLRLDITPGAWVQVWLSRDNGPFVQKWASHNAGAPTLTAYIRSDRCDRFRIRLVGKGEVVLRALTRELELGSEV